LKRVYFTTYFSTIAEKNIALNYNNKCIALGETTIQGFPGIYRRGGLGHPFYKLRKRFVRGQVVQNFSRECIHPFCNTINLFIRISMNRLSLFNKSTYETIMSFIGSTFP